MPPGPQVTSWKLSSWLVFISFFTLKTDCRSSVHALSAFQISWSLWLAGGFYRPIWPGCVHCAVECQPQPSVPEDFGKFGPSAVGFGLKTLNCKWKDCRKSQLGCCCFFSLRCCLGCWRAQRSSFPPGATLSTHRNLITSFHWPAARSGQLQQKR